MKRTEKLSRRARLGILAAIMAGAFSIMPAAQAMPTGGASETATITTAGNTMDIASSVTNNLLTWQDFSIAKGETVNFQGANTYLNVVTGANESQIFGALTGSEANVFLVNPNGILIGDGAQVNVGSLHLSTADIKGSLADFDTAKAALDGVATFSGDVVNKGTLKAAQEITVDGNNITFKNTADVTSPQVALQSTGSGEIHIGSAGGTASGYTIKKGTEIDYKLVSTAAELQNINNDLSGNYMLANDIDMNDASFTPIGKFDFSDPSAIGYSGKFDGLNYKISNMVINGDPNLEGVGLFGYVQNGTVENVGRVGGSTTGRTAVGSIVGRNDGGTIRNVYNTGTVTGTLDDKWSGGTGGIVGHNVKGTIKNVYNTGDVTTQNRAGGGIVGRLEAGTLENAYNTGKVTANNQNNSMGGAGGIIGWFDYNVTIKNVYNTGSVTGRDRAGGIAGLCDRDFGYNNKGPLTITNAYNTGKIMAGSSPGNAMVGTAVADSEVTVKDSFYTKGNGFTGATQVTEAAMKEMATFSSSWGNSITNDGSSTTAAWRIYEGSTMPLLTAFMTRKDNISSAVYDGTADVGYTSKASTKTSTQAEGINWVSDVTVVSPKALTISFDPIEKTYDGTTSATAGKGTLSGVVGEDSVSYDVEAVYDSKNAGSRTVNYSGIKLTGEKAKNYSIATETTGTGTITPATLTFNAADKVYDGTTKAPVEKGNLAGVIAGDDVSLSPEATGTYDGKDAGTHNVQYSGITLTGVDAKNYSIATETTGTGTITPATLTFNAADKVYDGTTKAPVEKGNLAGVIAGDDVSLSPEATGTYDGKDAGTHNVQYSGITLTGVDAKNYSIAKEITGTATITPAKLTFNAVDKAYNGTTMATDVQGTLVGVVAGEDVSYEPGITAVYDGKDAGTHNVQYSGIKLTGADAGNYSIESELTGQAVIAPAQLTITFDAADKQYDGTTDAVVGKGTLTGIVGTEDVAYAADAVTAAYDSKNAGSRTVTYSGIKLTGADAGNYSIAATTEGKGTINAAPLTLKVADVTKYYDGTTDVLNASYSIVGTLYGDDTLEGGVFAYTDKNVGTGKTVTLTGVTAKDGNEGGNYDLTVINSTNSAITINAPEIEAVTITTQGDDQGNVSFGEQHTITVVFDNEGTLTLVNGGINPPNSMDAEKVAKQNKDTKSNGENKEGE